MGIVIASLVGFVAFQAYLAFAPESKPKFTEYQLRQRAKVNSQYYAPNNF